MVPPCFAETPKAVLGLSQEETQVRLGFVSCQARKRLQSVFRPLYKLISGTLAPKAMIKNLRVEGPNLTVPLEITDTKLAKAYAHPLRIQILGLLDNRVASPREIAADLGTPLSNTSYHVRQLAALGFVELVSRTARRGAIEHHYTAKFRPTIQDEGWDSLPPIIKRAIADGNVQRTLRRVVAATQQGGFDRTDAHHSHTAGLLDKRGWETLANEMNVMLKRAETIVEESEARLAEEPEAEAIEATIVLMQFEGPSRKSKIRGRPRRNVDDLGELELDEASDLG